MSLSVYGFVGVCSVGLPLLLQSKMVCVCVSVFVCDPCVLLHLFMHM